MKDTSTADERRGTDPQTPVPADERLRRLNLNLLYTLAAILREPSLTAAGRSIALSQPAMSMALRRLRAQFDDDLVVFNAGTSQLTALGEGLRPRVERVLREAHDAFNFRMEFDPAVAERTITLSAPEPIELMFLRSVVPALLSHGPGLDIRLEPFAYDSVESLFARGVDVAIVPDTMADPAFPTQPLFEHSLVGMVWRDNVSIGESLSEEDYLAARHAALLEDMELAMSMGLADPTLAQRKIAVRSGLYSMLPNLVIETDLLVTTSNWLAQYFASIVPVRLVDVPFQDASSMIVAQWPTHRDREPYIRWLVDQIVAAVRWPIPPHQSD